jgi:indole-3-glycerol phosphate synthase
VQALSVLTEPHEFGGGDDHPALARRACALPILRKDFLVDRWQVLQSATLGVDAVLLIAALLPGRTLREFIELAGDLSLDALVEVHDLRELEAALAAGAGIVGVNNRNLDDFTVSLSVTEALAPHVPSDRVLVAESGIRTAVDAARMRAAGARALLVGEAFMREDDIQAAVSRLRGALP